MELDILLAGRVFIQNKLSLTQSEITSKQMSLDNTWRLLNGTGLVEKCIITGEKGCI